MWGAKCAATTFWGSLQVRLVLKFFKWAIAALLVLVAALFAYLVIMPPELLRVGAGYSSKIICSNAFIAHRDPGQVEALDVQAPGNPILHYYFVAVNEQARSVRSAFLQFVGATASVDRPGLGCAAVPDGDVTRAMADSAPPAPGPAQSDAAWPQGHGMSQSPNPAVMAILNKDAYAGPGFRAVVVVQNGRIVGERYAPGFDAQTPLVGWSMTKTITAALVGTVVKAGKLSLDQNGLLPQWANDDPRHAITVRQLLSMSSGLTFNEDYGDVSDVTRMLYLEPDMAEFAASLPLAEAPGTVFNYSTGTPVILSRIWQNAIGNERAALAWPRLALFGPLGMGTAVLETDESGTFAGGSYLYASARDWARFGQMLLQNGNWFGDQILTQSYVQMMRSPAATDAAYGQGLLWMEGPGNDIQPGDDAKYGVPEDAFWLLGHDGQSTAIVPSANLVVVRMGLTPARLDYRPQRMVAALVNALKGTGN